MPRSKPGPRARVPECHPERRHEAKGLCHSCYHIRWHAARPDKRREYNLRWASKNPERKREAHFKHEYGLTLDAVEALKQAQDGMCAVCLEPAELVVDHDHGTNEVRGMLCEPCNQGLGHFRDSPVRLTAAVQYLLATRKRF
jgi:Recombination endonuclease VII